MWSHMYDFMSQVRFYVTCYIFGVDVGWSVFFVEYPEFGNFMNNENIVFKFSQLFYDF